METIGLPDVKPGRWCMVATGGRFAEALTDIGGGGVVLGGLLAFLGRSRAGRECVTYFPSDDR